MSDQKIIRCIADDTALITNLDEVSEWVRVGLVILVVPLYSKRTVCNKDECPS